MITFEDTTADAVWRQAASRLRRVEAVQESRDQATRELLHVGMTITDPRQRVVFSRPINPAFAIAEVIWILAGANDSGFLRFWNPRMKQFTDDDDPSRFHGAYGYRLGSQPRLSSGDVAARLRHDGQGAGERLDQIRAAYEALRATPHSRQVVLQIWRSDRDLPDPAPRSRDIPCNLLSHLLVRNGRLEWLQVMRSNDLVWGTPYNFIQFTTMQEIMAGWLGVDVGTYNHISDSLHVYERHWADLGALTMRDVEQTRALPRNTADLRISSYAEWERVWAQLVDCALALAEEADEGRLRAVPDAHADLPAAYREWVSLLTAEALRRRGFTQAADEVVAGAGAFWATSWRRWAGSVERTRQASAEDSAGA